MAVRVTQGAAGPRPQPLNFRPKVFAAGLGLMKFDARV